MKRLNSLLLFKLFLSVIMFSQPAIEWSTTYGGSDYDRAGAIVQTTDGNLVIAGATTESILVKLDPTGALVWEKGYHEGGNSPANSILETIDGGLVVVDHRRVVKFNSIGNVQWSKTYGGSVNDRLSAMVQTTDGSLVIAGSSYSPGNSLESDYWVIKLDANGALQWSKTYGGSGNDRASTMVQTTDGSLVIAGHSNSTDGDVGGNSGEFESWVIKLNANGVLQWSKTYEGYVYANHIAQTANGDLLIGGEKDSPNYLFDYWVLKLDSDGNLIWNRTISENNNEANLLRSIIPISDGYILVGDVALEDITNQYDYSIIKLNSNGELLWEKKIGGSGFESVSSAIQVNDGGFVVVGNSDSNDGDVGANNGGADFWIVKLEGETTLEEYTISHYSEANFNTFNSPIKIFDTEENSNQNSFNKTFSVCADGAEVSSFIFQSEDAPQGQFGLRIKEDPTGSNPDVYGSMSIASQSITNGFKFNYTHPVTFPLEINETSVDYVLELYDLNSGTTLEEFTLEVFRVPVVLVHGLGGDNGSFDLLKKRLSTTYGGIYDQGFIFRANYPNTNTSKFVVNSHIVPNAIQSMIDSRKGFGISVGKIDLIGHSMGGLLIRLYLQNSGIYKDDIFRVITINTPHSGTQFANLLFDEPAISNTLKVILDNFKLLGGRTEVSALNDLKVDSDPIISMNKSPQLNRNIVPSHAIGTRQTIAFTPIAKITAIPKEDLFEYLLNLDILLADVYNTAFHDIIVPENSQLGGLQDDKKTIIPNQIHVGSTDNFEVFEKVRDLLKSSPKSNSFSQVGFNPVSISYIPFNNLESKNTSTSAFSSISINSPIENEIYSVGDSINIEVVGSNDINEILTIMDYNKDSIYFSQILKPSASFKLVADESSGERKIVVIGKDSENQIFIDSVKIFICHQNFNLFNEEIKNGNYHANNDIIVNGYIEDASEVNLRAGNSINLTNGFQTEKGISFSAKIEPCESTIALKERSKDYQTKLDNLPSQEKFFFDISPNPFSNTTTIQLTLPTKQDVKINLYDLNGRQLRQIGNQVMDKGTHTLTLDATELTEGFYFLNLQTTTKTMTKKVLVGRN